LNEGESLTDEITVATEDGTQQVITITIDGANDEPEFSVNTFGGVAGNGEVKVLNLDFETDLILTATSPETNLNNNASQIGVNSDAGGPQEALLVNSGEGIRAELVTNLTDNSLTNLTYGNHVPLSLFQFAVVAVSAVGLSETAGFVTIHIEAFLADDDGDLFNDPDDLGVQLEADNVTVKRLVGGELTDVTNTIQMHVTDTGIVVYGLLEGDIVTLTAAAGTLLGESAFNRVELENVSGQNLSDLLQGANPDVAFEGDNWAIGQLGVDTAYQQIVFGDESSVGLNVDALNGGAGDDLLVAAAGIDLVDGGAGRDVFKITTGSLLSSSLDIFDDYQPGQNGDLLDLTSLFIVDPDGGGAVDQLSDFVRLSADGVLEVDANGSAVEDFVEVVDLGSVSTVSILYNLDQMVQQETLVTVV
ncbi:MAG: VCBS domain-containing protein, partial [Hyphomicrobiales bacterium]